MARFTPLAFVTVILLAAGSARAEEDAPIDAARAEWIAERIERLTGSVGERDAAIAELISGDREGDCTDALVAVLTEHKKDVPLLAALIRALGRDHLGSAALPITEFLGHKEPTIRANAAVSLEYIGSHDKKVVSALRKAVGREKDEAIANHLYRALGRCGLHEPNACAMLLKAAARGKTEFATYGPMIGLAYFVGDKQATRGVEKLIAQIGIPGGRRGGGANVVRRGLASWTLASIGNAKSATFLRAKMIAKLEKVKAFWVEPLVNYWETVAEACEGDPSKMPQIEGAMRGFVGFARRADPEAPETKSLMDEARTGRSAAEFTPKGDGILGGGEDR